MNKKIKEDKVLECKGVDKKLIIDNAIPKFDSIDENSNNNFFGIVNSNISQKKIGILDFNIDNACKLQIKSIIINNNNYELFNHNKLQNVENNTSNVEKFIKNKKRSIIKKLILLEKEKYVI